MALPPSDIEPSELFRKLTEAPRPSDVIDYPRKDGDGNALARVRLQVLNTAEFDLARQKATEWFGKKFPNKDSRVIDTAREMLGDRTAKEVLAIACISDKAITGSEETGRPLYNRLFSSANDLDEVTADELTVLWVAQQAVQYRYGPYEGNIDSEEQVNAWMQVLVEGATAVPLAALSWHQLTELIMCLAERAYSLSVILGSPSKNLPGILDVLPSSWELGSYGHGKLLAKLTEIGLSREQLGLPEPSVVPDADVVPIDGIPSFNLPSEPMSAEDAAYMAESLHKDGKL